MIRQYDVESDTSLGQFQVSIILAKQSNKRTCIDEKLISANDRRFDMTPQEQLFVKYYNEKKIAIKDMSDLEIEAQREELSEIAAIARAGLTAIADEKSSRKGNKTIGFERSINVDDITSNAINQIESRNKRLSKKEKIAKMLAEMDVAPEDIQQILSARGLRDVQAKSNLDTTSPASPARKESNKTKVEAKPTPGGFDWDAIIAQAKEQGLKPQEPEPFILNPFEVQSVTFTAKSEEENNNGSNSLSRGSNQNADENSRETAGDNRSTGSADPELQGDSADSGQDNRETGSGDIQPEKESDGIDSQPEGGDQSGPNELSFLKDLKF